MSLNGWPRVPLGEVLTRSEEMIEIIPTERYAQVTVRLWGKGVVPRGEVGGLEIASSRRFLVRKGQFILSRIDARHGAFGIVPDELDGAIATNDFPSFEVNEKSASRSFLAWLSRTQDFVHLCRRASEGTTNRVRLKENRFLDMPIPLPDRKEQDRIVAKLDALSARIDEARECSRHIVQEASTMLHSAFSRIIKDAPQLRIGDVAPLVRRPVDATVDGEYPELGVRSFGKGVFHKPTLLGSELTWQKLFRVKEGDIVISNIKAWEGAIAEAGPDDDNRVGSHRYLTLVPAESKATAGFLCFYLMTATGLADIGHASPGSADRNRTLGQKALEEIEVPVPDYGQQVWFDRLQAKVREMLTKQQEGLTELDAMLSSILDKAFKGEL